MRDVYAKLLAVTATIGACTPSSPTPAPTAAATSSAPAPPVATSASGSSVPAGCVRVWTDADSVFRYRSMYEELSYDRAKRTMTEKVYTWPAPKSVTLSAAEHAEVDALLGGLCLPSLKGAPPPPPGGPLDATITSAAGEKRLGVKGSTGGDFFELTRADWTRVFEGLKRFSPEHRDCLPLGKDGVVIRGKLLETTRNQDTAKPGEKYALLSLEGSVCVAPEGSTPLSGPPVVMAGSIELRPAPALVGKRVVATGKLSVEKAGERREVVMTVANVRAE